MIELHAIEKRFAGTVALRGVSLAIADGECHALIGENGAGKSTLGKILAGVVRPDAGRVVIDGREHALRTPAAARRLGIVLVHQELATCADLSVAENVLLGALPRFARWLVDRRALRERASALLAMVGLDRDPRVPMRTLSPGARQLVQIAAALGAGARLVICDEPTSAISAAEAERLFARLAELRARGVAVVYVSHRLGEVLRLADRITVLRDGALVETHARGEVGEDELVREMVGRALASAEPRPPRPASSACASPALEAERVRLFRGGPEVSLAVRGGEIVGLAGLVGAGRSRLARALFGLAPRAGGTVRVAGRKLPPGDPRAAMRMGLGLVPDDRGQNGLLRDQSVRANWSLASLARFSRRGWLALGRERDAARRMLRDHDVKAPSPEAAIATLSGGNQQKVLLARWLARDSRVLIVDEPTRGVDVASKAAIHARLESLAAGGAAILLVSSELEELLRLATRVLVVRAGAITGELARAEATQERLLALM